MAFTLKTCLSNPCTSDGGRLNYKDVSGAYDATTNPTGYGAPGGPTSPLDFTSYKLSLWYPHSDTTGDPDYIVDLIPGIPTVDSDGYYTWSIGPADLNLEVIQSGVWWGLTEGVFGATTYSDNCAGMFMEELTAAMDALMNRVDVLCACKAGCEDPVRLYAQYMATMCGGQSSLTSFQKNVDFLMSHTSLCC